MPRGITFGGIDVPVAAQKSPAATKNKNTTVYLWAQPISVSELTLHAAPRIETTPFGSAVPQYISAGRQTIDFTVIAENHEQVDVLLNAWRTDNPIDLNVGGRCTRVYIRDYEVSAEFGGALRLRARGEVL